MEGFALGRAVSGNPYTARKLELTESFYPTPSAGFDTRLLVLIGLTAYLFVITSVFLTLYVLALRRQGKKVWAWRLVSKPEGSYIVANVYIASIAPILPIAVLLGALIGNNRQVFVERNSQIRTFLWRNLVWILVWIQGWISTYANVQAVFVISTATSSRHLPRLINTLYLVVPFVVFAGLLTPGVMCSNSWDFAFRCFERQIALLTPAEVQYDLTGALDAGVFDEVASLAAASATRLSRFYVEYLAMLIVWSMASVILVVVNIAGIFLILRLRQQIQCNALVHPVRSPSFTPQFDLPSSAASSLTPLCSVEDVRLDDDKTSHLGLPLQSLPHSASLANSQPGIDDFSKAARDENKRAMEKLVRDLIFTIGGVTFLAFTFASDTILLAILRHSIYTNWVTAEVGVTLIIWAYVAILSICMTGITLNQALFLFRAVPPTPLSTSTSTLGRFSVASSIYITSCTAITIDVPSPRPADHFTHFPYPQPRPPPSAQEHERRRRMSERILPPSEKEIKAEGYLLPRAKWAPSEFGIEVAEMARKERRADLDRELEKAFRR